MEMKNAKVLGAALPRVDGPKKLTGQAMYAADHHLENMLYGYGVYSTITKGTITGIETSAAKQMPGVVDVFHHNHFTDRIFKAPTSMKKGLKVDESRLPFEDNKVYYAGQMVAYVVADTFAKAREATLKVKVSYREDSNRSRLVKVVVMQKLHSVIQPIPTKPPIRHRLKPITPWRCMRPPLIGKMVVW